MALNAATPAPRADLEAARRQSTAGDSFAARLEAADRALPQIQSAYKLLSDSLDASRQELIFWHRRARTNRALLSRVGDVDFVTTVVGAFVSAAPAIAASVSAFGTDPSNGAMKTTWAVTLLSLIWQTGNVGTTYYANKTRSQLEASGEIATHMEQVRAWRRKAHFYIQAFDLPPAEGAKAPIDTLREDAEKLNNELDDILNRKLSKMTTLPTKSADPGTTT